MKVLSDIGWIMIVLLLVACSNDDDSQVTKQPAVINVYVYAPEHPLVTRGDVGEVAPISNDISESVITKLQIWVFNHDSESHELIAYYSPESVDNLNSGSGETYQLSASDAFTQADTKPTVDVYVVANIANDNSGIALSESTTRAELEDAFINADYFGLTPLIDKVPDDGLPMSGVLRGVTVTGSAPVFKISTVKLTRAVSKIHFVFSREQPESETDNVPVKINSIKLDPSMIPTQEYLFLETGNDALPYHVGSYGTGDAKEFLATPLADICQNKDPMTYSYQAGQDAQEYEDLIVAGLNKTIMQGEEEVPAPELTQVGPFYLRESGKKLTGTITFQKDDDTSEAKTILFEMHNAGDFSRNHTWIVYAYYSVSGLVAVTVVVKDWIDSSWSHELYNW